MVGRADTPASAPQQTSLLDDVTELRRQVEALQNKTRSLELLLDGNGRGMARMPSPNNLSALANEI